MTEKTRVSMLRPKSLRLWIALALVVITITAGGVLTTCRMMKRAAPMGGDCTEVPMKHYVGGDDKDGQVCLWKGLKYWCVYDPNPNKEIWDCSMIEPLVPAPTEKK